jgi:hypothetical protein
MRKNHKKLKAIVLLMVLAAGMLLPVGASAQDEPRHGGLFGLFGLFNSEEEEVGMLDRDGSGSEEGGYTLFNQQFGTDVNGGYDLHNQTFGQSNDSPLGSGWLILVAAGAGYALKKRKNNK